MAGDSFIAKILSPGGGILLIPFTRFVLACLFVVTTTVLVVGVARIHMFILSFLSAGMWISLGYFTRHTQQHSMVPNLKQNKRNSHQRELLQFLKQRGRIDIDLVHLAIEKFGEVSTTIADVLQNGTSRALR
eukprot:210183_1